MADESKSIEPEEIQRLLAQTGQHAASGPATPGGATAASVQSPSSSEADSRSPLAPGDIEFLLNQAQQALASVDAPRPPDASAPVLPFQLRELAAAPPSREFATLELVRDVELDLRIELGRTHMPLEEVLRLRRGAVVPLDKLAGDPVDIFVNGRLIARGEVLVMNDNFCVRVAELIAPEAARAG
jgi:flagellar motor switch protein FliN/FliY